MPTYHIVTFGCQANVADTERIASDYQNRGYSLSEITEADHVVINTCMVRQMAEDRVYGLYNNLILQKKNTNKPQKIIVTGCMVGTAMREPDGKYFDYIRQRMPEVDEFLPIEEVGFDHNPLRTSQTHAWVPISNGCNNFCTFCVVPFSRGREVSRPLESIISELEDLKNKGFKSLTLLGQNVNSYGADLIMGKDNIQVLRDQQIPEFFHESNIESNFIFRGQQIKPTYVKHLGKYRIPTLFPYLLQTICDKFPEFTNIEFMSSNPWDFSSELIATIANNPQISRTLHLPVQSGSNRILKKMNRWYTHEEYLELVANLKQSIPDIILTTDIIVGFPGETDQDFDSTYNLAKQVGFIKAYISRYSPRPATAATKAMIDDIPHSVKKSRWLKLEKLINKNSNITD